MAVLELTEELGLTEAGINVFEGIDSNEK